MACLAAVAGPAEAHGFRFHDSEICAAANSFDAVAAASFSGPVATFTVRDPFADADDFRGFVKWGDGTKSVATIEQQPRGGFVVDASHTYAEPGTFYTTVFIVRPWRGFAGGPWHGHGPPGGARRDRDQPGVGPGGGGRHDPHDHWHGPHGTRPTSSSATPPRSTSPSTAQPRSPRPSRPASAPSTSPSRHRAGPAPAMTPISTAISPPPPSQVLARRLGQRPAARRSRSPAPTSRGRRMSSSEVQRRANSASTARRRSRRSPRRARASGM